MTLSADDLYLLGQCAISAAYQAGHLIAANAKRAIAVHTKHAGGTSLAAQVVTEVDHLSQDIILRTLKPVCARFDLALLSEESPDDRARLQKQYFWCIDPLDGTLPFIEGMSGYSVSIGLVSLAGQAVIGVIYDPLSQTLYHAIRGQGAWRNGQSLGKPAEAAGQTLIFITDKSFVDDPLYQATLAELPAIAGALGYAEAKLRLQGGAAMNACQVLDAGPACYFKFPKPNDGGGSVWDYAASAALFAEIGLPVSDMFGRPLALNPAGSTFMNHCGVLYCADHAAAGKMIRLYRRLSGGG